MRKMRVFIVDYAYGFHANTCDVDYVSRLRSQAALRARTKYPDADIVLGAGMKEVTGDCGPLADIMEKFFLGHGVSKKHILRNPHGADTLSETEAAYTLIEKRGGGKIVCATSRFHAPRVWCIWFFRYGIMPELFISGVPAPHGERMKEARKIPRDILRAVVRRA